MRQLKIERIITDRSDGNSVDNYFQDISKIEPSLTSEEESSLAKRIQDGDVVARNKLVKANLRFVVSVAKQYQNQGMQLPDIINEGNIGLIKAAEKFDESKGFKFISYAVWWIRQSILQALAKQSRMVRLPLNKVGDITKMNKVIAELEQHLERAPNPEDIAEIMDHLGVDDIAQMMSMTNKNMSFDAPLEDDESSNMLDVFEYEQEFMPDDDMMNESLEDRLNAYMGELLQIEADILTLYFGMNGQMTLSEMSDIFGITSERVRQIKERAIRKLKRFSPDLAKLMES